MASDQASLSRSPEDSAILPPCSDGRTRYVPSHQTWTLKGDPSAVAPRGHRTPNGFVWGRRLTDFYWIDEDNDQDGSENSGDKTKTSNSRRKVSSPFAIWSTSMLKECGESPCHDRDAVIDEQDDQEKPRVNSPWSILTVVREAEASSASDTIAPAANVVANGNADAQLGEPTDSGSQENSPYFDDEVTEGSPMPGATTPTCKADTQLAIQRASDHAASDTRRCNSASTNPTNSDRATASCMSSSYSPNLQGDVRVDDDSTPQAPYVSAGDPEIVRSPRKLAREGNAATETTSDSLHVASASELPESDSNEGEPDLKNNNASSKASSTPTEDRFKVPPSRGPIPPQSVFSVEGLPKLEEFIPHEYLPDILEVHDPLNITTSCGRRCEANEANVLMYKRLYPVADSLSKSSDKERKDPLVARLFLHRHNALGTGNHSVIHRAPLKLAEPLIAQSRNGCVTVAVKTADHNEKDYNYLRNEGRMYNKFPKHLMEDWDGFNIVSPMRFPVPVGPVVPKFFGLYVHESDYAYAGWSLRHAYRLDYSPILLLEECGRPINSQTLTLDARSECYSLLVRLHHENFTQGSFHERNILVQPGPLSAPPCDRTMLAPSFRIIDFGRGQRSNYQSIKADLCDATDTLELCFDDEYPD